MAMMGLALQAAKRSTDPSTKVGAVVAHGSRVLACGCNALPSDVECTSERLNDRHIKLQVMLHAEESALAAAGGIAAAGCTLYTTVPPCAHCAAVAVQCGVKRIVSLKMALPERWRAQIELGRKLLREAEVEFIELEVYST